MREAVQAVWRDYLGIADIAPRDNFFEIGGHSLLAVQTHRALRERLGLKSLSITDIFRFPTLGGLADRLVKLGGQAPAQIAGPQAAPAPTALPQAVLPLSQPAPQLATGTPASAPHVAQPATDQPAPTAQLTAPAAAQPDMHSASQPAQPAGQAPSEASLRRRALRDRREAFSRTE